MITNFPACLAEILHQEAGNDDDPHDPGSRTSRGITQTEWDAYSKTKGLPHSDVWDAPDAAIHDIYSTSYWDPYCPLLPSGLDLIFFDMSVNQGLHEAVILSQRALKVKDDGYIGVVTRGAVESLTTPTLRREVIRACSAERIQFYRRLKTFKYFGRGWLSRVNGIEDRALEMVG